jgi:hypothetical protein
MDNLTQAMEPTSVSAHQPSAETPSLTFAPQPNCMLFQKLPGELRNEIIRLAVVEESEIKPKVSRSFNALTGKSTAELEIEHPLMQTCKQLRQESAEIYLLENTFHLTESNCFKPAHGEKYNVNQRAIQAMAHALGPWASKVSMLNVSHTACYGSLATCTGPPLCNRFAEVHVSICRAAEGVYLEKACAHDTDTHPLCCCCIFQHAADHSAAAETIFEFAQGLVAMMDSMTRGCWMPHCWNCGLEPMALGVWCSMSSSPR